ncbi:MAG: GerMN domain-containing protein [Lachnospiraceae bacterium]
MKSILRKAIVWSLGMVLILLCACDEVSREEKEEPVGNQYYIYKVENDALTTKEYYSETTDPDLWMREMLAAMEIPLKERGDLKEYGETPAITDANVSNGVAYVYFNDRYKKMDGVQEVLFRASVVKTLTQLDGINSVYFYVDGQAHTYQNGQIVGFMGKDDFIEDSGAEFNKYGWSKLTLYFIPLDGEKLEAVSLDVAYEKTVPIERVVVEQLMLGAEDEGYQIGISSKTKILGTTVRDGICYLNLSPEFVEDVNGKNSELVIYSIVNSLCELSTVSEVQFQINGDESLMLNGVLLKEPLKRNLDCVGK